MTSHDAIREHIYRRAGIPPEKMPVEKQEVKLFNQGFIPLKRVNNQILEFTKKKNQPGKWITKFAYNDAYEAERMIGIYKDAVDSVTKKTFKVIK